MKKVLKCCETPSSPGFRQLQIYKACLRWRPKHVGFAQCPLGGSVSERLFYLRIGSDVFGCFQ